GVGREGVPQPGGRHYYGVNDTRSGSGTRLDAIVNLNRARTKGAIVVGYNARCGDPDNPFFGGVDFSPIFSVKDGEFTQTETYEFGEPDGAGFAGRISTR